MSRQYISFKRLIAMVLVISSIMLLAACSDGDVSMESSNAGSFPAAESSTPSSSVKPTAPTEAPTTPSMPPKVEPEFPPLSKDDWTYGYTLTEVGSFADPNQDYRVYLNNVYKINGEELLFSNYLGQILEDFTMVNSKYLGNGLYMVTVSDQEINSTGLVSYTGEILIPFNACTITWATGGVTDKNNRYLKVIYTTGITENKNECFIFASDSFLPLRPSEGDTMYTGYALVYDTVTRSFVGDVKITNPSIVALKSCGRSFTVEDKDGTVRLYNSDGDILVEGGLKTANGAVIGYVNGLFCVFSDLGELTYSCEYSIRTMESENGYLCKYVDNKEVVIDRYGNEILSGYDAYNGEYNHVFEVDDNGKYGLVYADGTVILAAESDRILVYEESGIYRRSNTSSGEYRYDVIGMEGLVASGIPDWYDMCARQDGKLFIYNDGGFTLDIGSMSVTAIAYGLVTCKNYKDGIYYLYDAFSGELLLSVTYGKIEIAGDHIYTYQDGTWTVYRLNGPLIDR